MLAKNGHKMQPGTGDTTKVAVDVIAIDHAEKPGEN
jgi:hypothetical protein